MTLDGSVDDRTFEERLAKMPGLSFEKELTISAHKIFKELPPEGVAYYLVHAVEGRKSIVESYISKQPAEIRGEVYRYADKLARAIEEQDRKL